MRLDKVFSDESTCTNRDGVKDALVSIAPNAFEQDGRLHWPARALEVSETTDRHDQSMFVQIDLIGRSQHGNELGLFMRLNPEGARCVAQQLLTSADAVEAHIAAQAAAAIDKARNGGQQ